MISMDVSQAFYHLLFNPASTMQFAVSHGKLVYYYVFGKLQWYLSQPFSPPSHLNCVHS